MSLKRTLSVLGVVAIVVLSVALYVQSGVARAQQMDLVGTWLVSVPESDQGQAPFRALQTFHADGTFVETSSLLGLGGEGPAHGMWMQTDDGYALTFELFIFDEAGASVGMIRVRVAITLDSADHFTANSVVDIIDLDGTVTEGIDSGAFEGTRMQMGEMP